MPNQFDDHRRKSLEKAVQAKKEDAQNIEALVNALNTALNIIGFIGLAACGGVLGFESTYQNIPLATVGDMISVTSAPANPEAMPTTLQAVLVDGHWGKPIRACSIDIGMIEQTRGTFSVFAVPPGQVILSYAGGPTAPGSQDCAGAHQIMMSDADYAILEATQTNDPYKKS